MLFPQTKRAVLLAACAVIVANFGCKPADSGSGNTTTAQASAPQSDSTVAALVDLSATPDLAVSSFLDALKNGDESLATSMLTQVAQAEMQRTQAAIKPPGSPTAKFDVDEVEYLGEQQTGAHVLSTWTDTDESGKNKPTKSFGSCERKIPVGRLLEWPPVFSTTRTHLSSTLKIH